MDNTAIYTPFIYDLLIEDDAIAYRQLIKKPGLKIIDFLEAQIDELLLCRNPELSLENIKSGKYREDFLHDIGRNDETAGVWIYYPWKGIVLRCLNEEEFIEVRTNRNRNKITREEQKALRTKKIGIAGLSVGRSCAITIALERVAGEIRLADFDTIELSNMNRIKTSLTDLGTNKAISAAREIAEIDPFIKVRCYDKGLTDDNLRSFFTTGGKLDLFIEECDDLVIKLHSRIIARELKIPVIMEASDRCLLDIERFDLEPERPLLHGIIDKYDIEGVRRLKTFEEKLTLMSKIVDINAISERMRISLLEIGKSIRTWPQLGSEVTYGGGVLTIVAREILLGNVMISQRIYLDILSLLDPKL